MPGKAYWPCGIISILLLASCASSKPPAPGSDRYIVTASRTPFYRYGPAQGTGASGVLENGAHLTLLYKSFGYSRVMLQSGVSGYVSTDAIAPAPPEPKRKPASEIIKGTRKHSRQEPESLPEPKMEQPLGLPEMPSDPLPGFRY